MKCLSALGHYLKQARSEHSYSLRHVEAETKISNAYLSQLEGGKIKQPSPNILHTLCEFYGISYARASELAGYPVAILEENSSKNRLASRFSDITRGEEKALREYLDFLRSRK